jgi:hypothetical protein
MLSGANITQCEILLFLDADLTNLEPEHVVALVQPVYRGQADMTLGLFRGGRWHTDLSHWATPWLTGQRCLRAGLLAQVSLKAATGYGIETAISLAARRYGWRCQHVALPGVSHPSSEFHRGFWQGIRRRSKMYADVYAVWRAERGRELFMPLLFPRTCLILLLLLLLLVSSLLYARQWL